MSLIRLRELMVRQGRRSAIVVVVLSLGLLAAHHAGLHAAHTGPASHAAMAQGHDMVPEPAPLAPLPDDGAAAMVAVCLAVLPMFLLLAALALAGMWLVVSWPIRFPPTALRRPAPVALGAARDGPRVLCVMRC